MCAVSLADDPEARPKQGSAGVQGGRGNAELRVVRVLAVLRGTAARTLSTLSTALP
jgi:hypothetical protein